MQNLTRAAVLFATASAIILPAGAASAGEIGTAATTGAPYGTLTVCAGRTDGPASTIKLIRKGKVVKSFRLAGCKVLSAKNGLAKGQYKVRHTAPKGYRTTGWVAGGVSGYGDERASSVSRSSFRIEPRKTMGTIGFVHGASSNWVTFTRAGR